MAAKRKPPDEPGIPEWVLTYGDLMSLLLCFFILLAAFSEIKKPREYKQLIESINNAMGANGGLGPRHSQKNERKEQRSHRTSPEGGPPWSSLR